MLHLNIPLPPPPRNLRLVGIANILMPGRRRAPGAKKSEVTGASPGSADLCPLPNVICFPIKERGEPERSDVDQIAPSPLMCVGAPF